MLKKISSLLLNHWGIIVSGLLLTTLIAAPLIVFPLVNKDVYQGINIPLFGTDEQYYLTRANEILKGHQLGNIFLREGKDGPETHFTYVEYLLLLPIKFLGLAENVNVVTLYNVENFIGIFILIVLVYRFVWELSGDKYLSVLSALFSIGGYTIIYNKTIASAEANIYGRAVFPYLSSIAFFIFLHLLLRAVKSPSWRSALSAGIAFGALFYVFFYCWTFALAVLGCLGIVYGFNKDFGRLKRIATVTGIGLLLGAYNLVRMALFYTSAAGKERSYFLWAYTSHAPLFSKIGLVTLLLFLFFVCRRRADNNRSFFLGLILAGWAALNQQIVTGRTVQPGHYYWFFIVPVSLLLCWYMIWCLIPKSVYRTVIFWFVLAVVLLNTIGGQYRTALAMTNEKRYEQNFRTAIDYLHTDPKPGVVLASNDDNGYMVTIFTVHDLFWHNAAVAFNTPRERVQDALFAYLFLNKNARNNISQYLSQALADQDNALSDKVIFQAIEGSGSGLSYDEYITKATANDPALLLARGKLLPTLAAAYKKIATADGISMLLKKYGVNYILWDKNKNPEWDLSVVRGLAEVSAVHDIHLYKFR